MIHIKHPLFHIQTAILQSQNYKLLHYQLSLPAVIDTNEPNKLSTHTSQVIPFYDPSFVKSRNYFQGSFLPDDFSLDLHTLQHQQTQSCFGNCISLNTSQC